MLSKFNTLRQIQSLSATDLVTTLRTVEINAIDICNRACSFCPRSDERYTNKKTTISLEIIQKIAKDLNDINFNGRISFVGFGEPLLYKKLPEAINIIKNTTKLVKWIEIVTNADYLNQKIVNELTDSGCTNITVSMYDTDITDKIVPLFVNSNIELTLKKCFEGFQQVNRTEILLKQLELSKEQTCYLPFYKMFIDVDGKVILCANDWGREGIIGDVTVETIKDIWLGNDIQSYREMLLNNTRLKQPCIYCNINGTKFGIESYTIWKNNVR